MDSIKDLLIRIRFSDIEIKSLISLKQRMEENALSINSDVSERVSGSKNLNRMYDTVNEYTDLGEIINQKLKLVFEYKKIALNLINELDNPLHRVLLIERYFNAQSWKYISIITNRSEKWVRTDLHSRALKQLECSDFNSKLLKV